MVGFFIGVVTTLIVEFFLLMIYAGCRASGEISKREEEEKAKLRGRHEDDGE